uniref:Putative outer membrane adhesin like protein n=1 Tax=Shewanella sp. (strain MR-7) TaxID=60481 RepID=Q0HQI3_SHESR
MHLLINTIGCWELIMGSIITTKKGLLKLVKGQIEVEVNGSNQPAKDGEQLPKGAVLHIGENATYEITFDDGTKLSNEVPPNATAAAPNTANEAALDEIQALQDLIASGEDPTQNLPETAAGNAPASDGNSGYVTLARDGTEALATSGYSTSGQTLTAATTAAPEQTVATDSPSVLANDSNTVDEDTVASGNVLDNDVDADNELTVVGFNLNGTDFAAGTVVTLEGGSFILNADGSYTFTPNENWNGQVPVITYTTNTGSTATLTINITPVDDPSVLANDSNTIAEDTVATGNVLDNDSDVDSSLSVVSFTVSDSTFAAGTTVALEGGSLVLNADGSYTFTPNENWNGQVPVITYTTNTGSTATLTINVTPVDDPSVLANDTNTIAEDTVATGNVLDNDSDVDSSLSVVSFTVSGSTFAAGATVALEGGSLVLNADGSYSFTPNADWNGQVPVITYTTNTGSTATLTINVTPVDDPSVLANDTNTIAEDTVATGNVLDNDSDVDSSLSVVSFTVSGSTFAAGTTVALAGGSLVLNADGSYTFTPSENWNGQVPVITYTTNTSSTATLTINVTPVADGAPSVTITTDTDNDGFISNTELGGATEVSVTIGLDGTGANAGDTLTVNGVDYVLTQEDINNGFVNLTLPAPAEGETITVVATITDPAGNTSPEGSDSALLDTTAPTITVSAPDDTRDTTPTITGTTDAAPGSVITIVVTDSNGVQQTLTTTVNPDGTYAVDVINPIPHGGYTATATVTDPAGNTGNATDNGNVDIKIDEDGDGNTVAITSITQDTGSSSSDFITNDNTLVFHGTVDLDDESTLVVTINGVDYTTANGLVIDAQGNWSVDLTGTALPDGTYLVVATVTDVAGNTTSATQNVVIDTKIDQDSDGNTVAITSITQDTGSSSSDFITNDNTLVFHGTVDLDDESTLVVTINGVDYTTANGLMIDAQGNWSVDLTGTALPDGIYTVVATVTDIAGNTTSATQDVIVDTQIGLGRDNAVTITSITEDTGSSNTDFITNDNTLVFQGTVELDGNSNLVVTINGVDYTIGNGLVIDENGHWSIDLTGTALPDGTYPVVATVTDIAGNSKTVTQDVVIDTKIDQDSDGNTVAITSITQDTGSSSSDFITNDNTLVFHGTVDLDDESTLVVTINGVDYTTANGLVIDAQGNWSVDLTGTALPDGTYPVVATVTDVAGNTTSATQNVVIDTKIDQDSDGNTVAITSITQDTGSSSSDFITNDNTLVFHGTVDLDDESTLVVTINGVDYTTANGLVIDAQGNWSVDLTGTALPDGTYPVVATVTDVAGNTTSATQNVVIDTKIDQDSDGNTVAITSITQDTGSSSSDFITNDNTLVFHGTVDLDDESTLVVTINGVDYTTANGLVIDAQGNWSVDLTGTALPDGTYPVVATVTDVAGNTTSATQNVVIDTKIDQDSDGNTVAITSITQDTGSSSSDFITNDNTLVFHGTVDLDDESTLVVTINGVDYTTANGLVIDAQGNWSVDLTGTALPDGTYPVVATVTDVAGNTTSATQNVVIDTTADAATPVVTILDDVNNDGIINKTELGSDDVQLQVNVNHSELLQGGTINLTIVNDGVSSNVSLKLVGGVLTFADGTPATGFSYNNGVITWTAVVAEGKTISVTATQTDSDGNTSAEGSDSAKVDTTADAAAPVVTILDDVNNDGIINKTELGSDDVQLQVNVNHSELLQGGTINLTIVNDGVSSNVSLKLVGGVLTFADGTPATGFSYNNGVITWTAVVAEGKTISVTATQTDSDGNTSAEGSDSAKVDTTADAAAPVVTILDDVNNDGIINKTELGSDDVQLQVNVNHSELLQGGTINLTIVNDGVSSNVSLKLVGGVLTFADGTPATGFSYNNGVITWTAVVAEGKTISVTATQTDSDGNTSAEGSDSAKVDTTADAAAPVVTILDDVNNDGIINKTELGSDDVQLQVNVNHSELLQGGTINLTIVNDGVSSNVSLKLVSGVLTFADGTPATGFSYNNGVITWTAVVAEGKTISVTATQTDSDGNTSAEGSDSAKVDTTADAAAPVVTILDDVNNDGIINKTELGSDDVQLQVNVNHSELLQGGTINLTIVNDGVSSNVSLKLVGGVLTFADGTPATGFSYNNGVITWTAVVAEGKTISVTATQTDSDGNTSAEGSDSAKVDTTADAAAPVVTILDDVNNDGIINKTELGSDDVQLQVNVNHSELLQGGTINLTIVNDGVSSNVSLKLVGGVLTFADGTPATGFSYNNGVITWTAVVAEGKTISVTATQTDSDGNTSAEGSDSAKVDTTADAAAPVVTILDDVNNDGIINKTELGSDDVQLQVNVNHSELLQGGTINLTIVNDGVSSNVSLKLVGGVLTFADGTPATGFSYNNGVITWTAVVAEGKTISVTATQTDSDGNTSAEGSDSAKVDTTADAAAPVVTILDDVNNDGIINKTELGSDDVQLQVNVNHSELLQGGTINLTIVNDGVSSNVSLKLVGGVLTFADGTPATGFSYNNGVITWTAVVAEGKTISVTATQTDSDGNTSAEGSDSAKVDTTADAAAPVVTILDDVNNDGIINKTELGSDDVQLQVNVNHSELLQGGTINLTIVNDGVSSNVSLKLVGGVLTFADGTPATGFSYNNGVITWTAVVAEGKTISVTATQTDSDGNTSAEGSDSAKVDTTADAAAPVVTILDDVNNDGIINKTELGSDDVQLQVNVNHSELLQGGTINLTIVNDGVSSNVSLKLVGGVLTFADGTPATGFSYNNGVITWTAVVAEGKTISVTATQTDSDGNTSAEGSDSAKVDTTADAAAPVVTILDDVNNDGIINKTELGSDDVQLQVNVNHSELLQGGTINLTIVNDGVSSNVSLKLVGGVLTFADGTPATGFSYNNGVITWTAVVAEGKTISVTATQTDSDGNTSAEGSDSAKVDTTADAAAPVVTILDDVNNDGIINKTELGSDDVQLQVNVNHSELLQGGTINLTIVNDGVSSNVSLKLVGGVLTFADGTPATGFSYNNGVITWTAVVAEGKTISVTATQTDSDGNTSAEGSDSAKVDTTADAAAPVVTILDDVNNDGIINKTELGSDDVQLQVNVNHSELLQGGTINLTIVNDGVSSNVSLKLVGGVLTFADGTPATGFSYNNGVITWTAVVAEGKTISVTATQTDSDGNTSAEGSDSAKVDTTADAAAPVVTILDDVNNDGIINKTELGSDDVQLQVNVNHSELLQGGTINLTIVNDGVSSNVSLKLVGGVLTFADGTPATGFSYNNGVITWTAVVAEGKTISVTATQTDSDGNTSAEGSDSAKVDTTADAAAPVVTILDDVNNDGIINKTELGSDDVQLQVNVNHSELLQGGTINLTIVNDGVSSNVSLKLVSGVLTFADGTPATGFSYNNGVITWTAVVAEGKTISVTATQTDSDGNTSAEGSDSAKVDTTAPNAPTVLIVDDGNPGDGLLTTAEMGNDGVQLTVSINDTDFEAGGYVTLTINGGAAIELSFADFTDNGSGTLTFGNFTYANGVISWSESAPTAGQSITVTATQTDAVGNISTQGSDTATVYQPNSCNVIVNESSLRDNIPDTFSNTISFTAGNQNITQFRFNDSSISAATNLAAGVSIIWALAANGELVGTIGGIEVIKVTLSGTPVTSGLAAGTTGAVTVNVELLDNIKQVNGLSGENLSSLINGIVIEAVGADNSVLTGNVTITINDDVINIDPSAGSGVNSATAADIVGVLNILGADGNDHTPTDNYSVSLSANVTGWNGTSTTFADSGITAGGLKVYYYVDPDHPNILIAYTDTNATTSVYTGGANQALIFTLTTNATTGQYTLDMNQGIDKLSTIQIAGLVGGQGGIGEAVYVTYDPATHGYGVYNDITKIPADADIAFTLTARDGNNNVAQVNGTNNGFGVANPFVQGNEVLIVDYSEDAATASFSFTGAAQIHYKAYDDQGNLLHEGNITSGQLIQNVGSIAYIELSALSGTSFQFTGTTAQTIVSSSQSLDLSFVVTATDSDGDNSSGNLNVHLDPPSTTPLAPVALTPNTFATLNEADLQAGAPDSSVQTLSFKSGSNSIGSFQFGDISNISVVGINAQIHWALNDQGQLIGTVYGREAIRLTLDWDRINAGEQGDVTVTAELLTNLPHSVNTNNLTVNGIQVIAVDGAGNTAHSNVTVTVADDVNLAQNDTAQLDVVVDSFNFSGIVANWTGATGGTYVNKYDGPDNDSGDDQLRWGTTNGSQSGYGFADNDAALNGSLSLNQDIVLGTFTHYNYSISSGTSITAATMNVTFNVTDAYGVVTPVTLTLNFSHNETPNSNDPMASRDIVTVGQTNVTFNYEGQMYTMQVIGFKDSNGNIVTSIYTNENASTSYELVVRMVAGTGYTLPHTDGNVLTNDVAGADGVLAVIGVASGDHTNTGVSGQVGTTITGTYGNLILYADGTYHYQLTASANTIPSAGAIETFTYTTQDGDGDKASATLKIDVNPVNADGINIADANLISTQGSSLNDTIVVMGGEKASDDNQKILNVTFGGGQSGIITNSSGHEVVASGANNKSYTNSSAQVVNGGDGNDHIETGKGDDVIYAGKTGSANYGTDDQLELSVNTLLTHHIMTGNITGNDRMVDNDGLLLANDVSSQRADVVNGGSGNDQIYGQSGSDILYGHSGNDYIDGGNHNDALRGGEGNDTLIGGLGDDVLRGDSGNDTFLWRYADADQGTDHIMDFNVRDDKLDLSDLLQGETANTLESYLNFSLDNGSTVIDIDANKDGVFDQHIVLDGVNLFDQYSATDNAGVINGLLGSNGNGPLIIDAAPVTPEAPQGVTSLTDPHHNNGTIIP